MKNSELVRYAELFRTRWKISSPRNCSPAKSSADKPSAFLRSRSDLFSKPLALSHFCVTNTTFSEWWLWCSGSTRACGALSLGSTPSSHPKRELVEQKAHFALQLLGFCPVLSVYIPLLMQDTLFLLGPAIR